MQEKIMAPSPGLTVFPPLEEVFVAEQVDLGRHLHPLISVDLAQVNPAWTGRVHLLSPLEPVDGYLGEYTEAFHSGLQTTNWLGFTMEGDQYRLTGDVRYFARATTPEELPDPWAGFRVELEDHCATEERSYQAHREMFRREGMLFQLDDDGAFAYGERSPVPVLDQLGGTIEPGNWADAELFSLGEEDDQVWPISAAGNRFHFVAAVAGWHYRRSGADWIILFFEPVERLALLTFDWS